MFILVFITFESFVVCFDVSPLIQKRIKRLEKINLLEILKSKPKVIGLFYPTWFNFLISPTTCSQSYLHSSICFLLPTHSNPQWLKMAAEVLLQHINFSLSSPILSSKCWKIFFSLQFTPLEVCWIHDHHKKNEEQCFQDNF